MRRNILRRLSAVVAPGEGQALGERAVEVGLVTAEQLRLCEEEAATRPGVTLRTILQERAGVAAQALDVIENLLRREAEGRRIGSRYRIDAELGRGGMGVVHRGFDLQLRRPVAVKFLHPDVASVPGAVERMKREAAAVARLNHPNIPAVHDMGESEGAPYLVLEIVEGPDFDEALALRTLDRRARLGILEKVARAIHHAHEHGIVHRDLKPANIRLDGAGEPHVLDFGLAHLAESAGPLTKPGVPYGTPFYMAPEQIRATSPADARTDVYGLGVMLYQAVVGRLPHRGDDSTALYRSVLEDPAPRPREVDPAIPADLEAVVMKAIEKDPADRYASAREFADDLRRFLEGDAVRARPPSRFRRVVRGVRRRWVVGALVLLAAAAGFAAWRRRASDVGPMADLVLRTLPALRELEAGWHSGGGRASSRLAEIESASDAAPPGPGPAAWKALARFFANRPGALEELTAVAGRAGDDPWPHLLLARAHLAQYAREVPVPMASISHLATAPPAALESPEGHTARLAAAKAAGMAASPMARDYLAYLQATARLGRGEYLQAGREFLALRNHAMLDAECLVLAGISFALGQDTARAAEAMEAAAGRGRPSAMEAAGMLRHRRAYEKILAGEDPEREFQAGLEDFDRLAGQGAGEEGVRMGRGTLLLRRALWRQGNGADPIPDFDLARTEFTALIQANRAPVDARYHRGRTEYQRGLYLEGQQEDPVPALRRAIEDLEASGDSDPRVLPARSDARRELGRVLGLHRPEGRALVDRAIGEAEAAVRAQPAAPWPAFAQGAALAYQAQADESDAGVPRASIADRYAKAVTELTRVMEGGWPAGEALPVRGLARLGLAEASARPDVLEQAIADFTEALAQVPAHMVCLQNRAAARVLQAQWDQRAGRDPGPALQGALGDFEAVASARPAWGQAWLGAAQCREALGRRAEALAAYEEAWKLGIRGTAIEQALKRLRP